MSDRVFVLTWTEPKSGGDITAHATRAGAERLMRQILTGWLDGLSEPLASEMRAALERDIYEARDLWELNGGGDNLDIQELEIEP